MNTHITLTPQQVEFIIRCIQSYESTPYYKEDRDFAIMESIISNL